MSDSNTFHTTVSEQALIKTVIQVEKITVVILIS